MVVSIKLFIHCWALDAEIGAEVDDAGAEFEQRDCKLRSDPVGQSEKNDLRLFCQQNCSWLAETKGLGAGILGKLGENLPKALPGILARSYGGELDVRMREEQTH